MSRMKKPHVVFYTWQGDCTDCETEVGVRELARTKRRYLGYRRGDLTDPVLIIYAGRLGEDLKYVETV